MTRRHVWALIASVVMGWPGLAAAQTPRFNKVIITSTIFDALCVGQAVGGVTCTGGIIAGPIAMSGVLTINTSANADTAASFINSHASGYGASVQAGDASHFAFNVSDRTGGTTALRVYGDGATTMAGSVTAPSFVGALTGNVAGNVTGNVTGDLTGNITGNVTIGGYVRAAAGNVSAPSLSFSGDTSTGMYSLASSSIGFSTTGTLAVNIRDHLLSIATVAGTVDDIIMSGGSTTTTAYVRANNHAAGAGNYGGYAMFGSNTSGGGAPAFLSLEDKTSTAHALWVDSSGNARISNTQFAPAEGASDTSGTVVGTQTSTRETKDILGLSHITPQMALEALRAAPVYDFRYRNGAYGGTQFVGLTIDDSPWVGMDPDAAHPHGRSFNPITAQAYDVLAIQALAAELAQLRQPAPRTWFGATFQGEK